MISLLLAATLHLAGDSTLDDCAFRYPYRSWGRETESFMKAGCSVENFAKSGHSTKSFDEAGYWAKLIASVKPGDFVVMQFGHNDQKRSKPFYVEKRWAAPNGLYKDILRRWVGEVRAKGATPVIVSPICRGTFDADGKRLVDREHASDGVCLRSYRDAAAALAKELGCDFVDMNTLTREYMEGIGREESEKLFVISTGAVRGKDGEPSHDVSHPAKAGAEAFAKLFVDDVTRRGLPVASLFRKSDFPITAFGAKPDGAKCTAAFAAAFAAAEKAGGGRIIVPPGKWFTGSIRFKSNCELRLEEGAKVVFSQDPADYLPPVFTSWEGMECINYCPLVYAYCCTNVAITGSGTLCGYEGKWPDTTWYPWVWQKNGIKAARLQLYTWGATDFPVEKREIWKTKNANTRPHFVQFNRCRNVKWHGFKVRNSPFWTLHLYQCENASVRGLDVYAHGNNNDGIDIEMSRDVLVEKCVFDQGDDGVVIKSGRNRDAWRIGKPTENVLVRNCEIRNAHTVLGIGSEISGGVRNVKMKDCTAGDIARVFFLKTNRRRGAFMESISCENVKARRARRSVFEIDTDVLYEWADFPDYENRKTRISHIRAENISVGEAMDVVRICADKDAQPQDVRWRNITAERVLGAKFVATNAGDSAELAYSRTVKMLPDERWWGVMNYYGSAMPFDAKTDLVMDVRKENMSNQAASFLVSDKGRFIWCDGQARFTLKSGAIAVEGAPSPVELNASESTLRGAFLRAAKMHFPTSGKSPDPLFFSAPQYNTWIELTYHQNEKDILAYAKSMLDNGLPPGVIMIDDTWQAGYGDWRFEPTRFGDPKGMVDRLHAMGFKVMLWMCPYVSMDTPAYRRIAWGVNPDDVKGYPTRGGFLGEKSGVVHHHYKTPEPAAIGWWNGKSAFLDFTHPNANAWFREQLDRLVKDFGVDGFKFDGGHFAPYAQGYRTWKEGATSGEQVLEYAKFSLEYPLAEYRNAWRFQGVPVVERLHDKGHRWSELAKLVPDMIAGGLLGHPFMCPDMVGGGAWTAFLPGAPFDQDLFVRSAQVHALCGMMQFSASPWRCLDERRRQIVRDVVKMRQEKFAKYFVELADECGRTGEPMIRNLEYNFPGAGLADVKDEFMMGSGLLVAPVVEKGATSRKVVLPPGRWTADDGAVFDGPAVVEVAAPLERLPYFVRD